MLKLKSIIISVFFKDIQLNIKVDILQVSQVLLQKQK